MNLDIAKYLRIAMPAPTDDFVEKRRKAVNDLAARFRKRTNAEQFITLASTLTGLLGRTPLSLPSGDLRTEVANVIVKSAPSFVADESSELELAVCALLGAAQVIATAQADGTTTSKPAWLAAALLSGLSFLQERTERQIEALRTDMFLLARDFLVRHGEAARRRIALSTEPLPRKKESETDNDYLERLVSALDEPVSALKDNAVLDREEIDLLWWAINDWSMLLNQRFSTAEPRAAVLASGIEFAALLARYPVRAHRDLAMRNLRLETTEIPLLDFSSLDTNLLEHSARMLGNAALIVRANPLVFPFLWTVVAAARGSIDLPKEAQRVGLRTDVALRVEDWARRALDELSLLKAIGHSLNFQATMDGD